jgi:hypothetical protein
MVPELVYKLHKEDLKVIELSVLTLVKMNKNGI